MKRKEQLELYEMLSELMGMFGRLGKYFLNPGYSIEYKGRLLRSLKIVAREIGQIENGKG